MNVKRELQFWGLLLFLLLFFIELIHSQNPKVRQARLDANLIAAVHSHDASAAVNALTAGANPNVRDYYRPLPTLLIRLRHPDAAAEDNHVHAEEWMPVLASAIAFGGDGKISSRNRNGEIVQALLRHGAQVNARDFQGDTALDNVPTWGDVGLAKTLLDHGAKVNSQDKYGAAPLMSIGSSLNVAMTRLLLERGANPNLQDCGGETALMHACFFGKRDIVRLLLNFSAEPNLRDHSGRTARERERKRRLPDPATVRLLKQHARKPPTSSRKTRFPSSRSSQNA